MPPRRERVRRSARREIEAERRELLRRALRDQPLLPFEITPRGIEVALVAVVKTTAYFILYVPVW